MATAGAARSMLRATLSRAESSAASASSSRLPRAVASSSRTYMSSSARGTVQEPSARAKRVSPTSRSQSSQSWQSQQARGAASAAQRRTDAPAEDETPEFNVRLTPPAAQDITSVQRWLRAAFPATPFPDDVALQFITHESWDHGIGSGHNRRLAFIGRRALKFYMSLFLAERAPERTTSLKVDDLLQTSRLGDGPGRLLNLAEVMRWTPAINDGQLGPKETGLFKIRGVTVEALIGAIYHQHGASAARSFFQSRILPTLGTFDAAERESLNAVIEDEQRIGEAHLASMAAANGVAQAEAEAAKTTTSDAQELAESVSTVNTTSSDSFFTEESIPSTEAQQALSQARSSSTSAEAPRVGARRRFAVSSRRPKTSSAFEGDDMAPQSTLHLGTA